MNAATARAISMRRLAKAGLTTTWGGVGRGRWAEHGPKRDVHGTCDHCGRLTPARDLTTVALPFGRGEQTIHAEGCN